MDRTDESCPQAEDLPRSDIVFRELLDDILSLRILPTDRLYESVIAEKYDASRTPVRAALHKLASEGLLSRHGRAYRVPEITYEFVDNLYSVREALECKSVELFVQNNGPLNAFEPLLDKMEDAIRREDYQSFTTLDIAFHSEIAAGASNDLLDNLLTTIWNRVIYVRNAAFRQPDRMDQAFAEHRCIIDAIRRQNATIAVEEMRAHLRSAPEFLKRNLIK